MSLIFYHLCKFGNFCCFPVPPYEVVRFRGPLEDSGGGDGGGGDSRGGGGDRPPSTPPRPPSTTSSPAPEPPGARSSATHVVHMAAFGREHALNLRRTEGLLRDGAKDVPTWTADKANSSAPVQLEKLPQVSSTHTNSSKALPWR